MLFASILLTSKGDGKVEKGSPPHHRVNPKDETCHVITRKDMFVCAML